MLDLKVEGTIGAKDVSSSLEGLENALVVSSDEEDFMVSAIGKFDEDDPILIIRAIASFMKNRMCQDFPRNGTMVFTEALCDTIIHVTDGFLMARLRGMKNDLRQ